MTVDYFSLLSKAVAGKDTPAREKIYADARALIARSNLSRHDVSEHAAALEEAVLRIEADIAVEIQREAEATADINSVLSEGTNWTRVALAACAVVAMIGIAVSLYFFVVPQRPREAGAGMTASRPSAAGRQDAVMADLKSGVDGGSSAADLPFSLQRQVVFYRTTVVPGSIVVDRDSRFLYLIDSNNSARRYGIGIAQECLKGASQSRITNKMEWPEWPANVKDPATALREAAGKPGSLLGARALLLDKPGLLIHGTNSPKTIGHLVASGCIRLVNDDVEDLYRRVSLDSRVIFIS